MMPSERALRDRQVAFVMRLHSLCLVAQPGKRPAMPPFGRPHGASTDPTN